MQKKKTKLPTLRARALNYAVMAACYQASSSDDLAVVRYCLENGADILWYDRNGCFGPLHAVVDAWTPDYSIYACMPLIVQALLDHGADINHLPASSGTPPIWRAAHFGNSSMVQFLLDYGADVNARSPECIADDILWSPLAHANLAVVDLLLAAGCRVDNVDRQNGLDAMDIVMMELRGDAKDDAIELLLHYHPDHVWLDWTDQLAQWRARRAQQNTPKP